MIVRKAKLKDVNKITKYGVNLLKQHYAFDPYFAPVKNVNKIYQKFFRSCIYAKTRLLLVAEEDKKIIGYALGEISSRPPVFKIRKTGFISDIFVEKNSRKNGIAKQFLAELKKWFKNKKLKHIELTVHVKNEVGKKAWNNYGLRDSIIKKRVDIEKFNIR
ncbi:MAG TPA: GNAT family N-acetyltransferase [Patescibacteria group bacterium]|uniref:N-acetyltransferase domain-containing protein n=1 Tax=Candidatus Falkowbacteria bacterium RIFOXYC2_FULL_36_12 TaxID=1798002 RepID=A0A1F5T162_9BACT|nr:MAG: hypothetical protein A2478_01135 [Candidatus Falkowbacteria bacterium RIFOXYC2_FULL_36_12]HLD31397.1 GNAT family N-acetyltransferase [Patescibacteria group bacterium]